MVGQQVSQKRAVWLAVALLVLTEGIWIGSIVAGSAMGSLPAEDILWSTAFLLLPVIAAAMAARRPENPIGWAWLVGILITALAVLIGDGIGEGRGLVDSQTAAWLAVASDVLVPFALILILFPATYLFPDGRLPSRRWILPAMATVIVGVIQALAYLLRPTVDMISGPSLANPLGIGGADWLDTVVGSAGGILFGLLLVGAISLIVRYRVSSGVVRLQLKWVALVVAVALAGLGLVIVLEFAGIQSGWYDFLPLLVLGFGYPIAVWIAIARYRLFAIDRLISRTVVYGVVVIVLGAVYAFGAVWLPTRLVGEQSTVFVAGSTLAVAMAFNPLRRRVRALVDRRFHRSRYEAERVAARFTAQLRDQVDIDRIGAELTSVVKETLNPTRMGLWLRT
jgi:hypothetical protein